MKFRTIRLAFGAGLLLTATLSLSTGCGDRTSPPARPPGETSTHPLRVEADTHGDLVKLLREHRYDWETLLQGVPPFVLKRFPADLMQIEEPAERKRLFFLSLLPMVLLANEQISQQREELQTLFERYDRGETLSPEELQRVGDLSAEYNVERDPLTNVWVRERLLERVDILPPSLVLAQAATESGYGTSRFAQVGNNLFGELTFIRGTGVVSLQEPTPPYEARRFGTLLDSVHAYMKNLNSNSAYRSLWRDRALMRARGLTLRGTELAGALAAYSERGEDYVRDIRTIINGNRLSLLSDAKLRPAPPPPPPRPVPATASLLETPE